MHRSKSPRTASAVAYIASAERNTQGQPTRERLDTLLAAAEILGGLGRHAEARGRIAGAVAWFDSTIPKRAAFGDDGTDLAPPEREEAAQADPALPEGNPTDAGPTRARYDLHDADGAQAMLMTMSIGEPRLEGGGEG